MSAWVVSRAGRLPGWSPPGERHVRPLAVRRVGVPLRLRTVGWYDARPFKEPEISRVSGRLGSVPFRSRQVKAVHTVLLAQIAANNMVSTVLMIGALFA